MLLGLLLIPLLLLTGVLGLAWLLTRNKYAAWALALIWLPLAGLVLLGAVNWFFTAKKELRREDIYGEYVIDRTKYPGRQADWQYNHFRFEITEQGRLLFHVTEQARIVKTYVGRASFLEAYRQPRLVLQLEGPSHHIVSAAPTLYRTPFSFYYVFHSPKFGNVFFTKQKWQPLAD